MRLVALLFALAGCGRLDFAERTLDAAPAAPDAPDAPLGDVASLGHDEDGDGIPDANDPCPHVAGTALDSDSDGVGDDCDPNPSTPTEHWVLFATMQPGDTGFDDSSAFLQEPDSLRSTNVAAPYITMPLGKVRIDMGWEVHAVVGTDQHQVALGVDENPGVTDYYFAELNDNMGFHDAAVVQYDTTTFMYTQLDQRDPGPFHTGPGLTRLDCDTIHNLVTGWTGQMYAVKGSTPAYTGGKGIRFALNGIDVSINYLAIIATE